MIVEYLVGVGAVLVLFALFALYARACDRL